VCRRSDATARSVIRPTRAIQRLRSSIMSKRRSAPGWSIREPIFRTQALREKYPAARRGRVHAFAHRPHHGVRRFASFSYDLGSIPVLRVGRKPCAIWARVYEFASWSEPFSRLSRAGAHIFDGPFRLGETTITPLPVPHGKSMVNGYLFSREGKKTGRVSERLQRGPGALSSARLAKSKCSSLTRSETTGIRRI